MPFIKVKKLYMYTRSSIFRVLYQVRHISARSIASVTRTIFEISDDKRLQRTDSETFYEYACTCIYIFEYFGCMLYPS